jgi:cytoskeletal protein RodZ
MQTFDKLHNALFLLFIILMTVGFIGLPFAVWWDFHVAGIV